MKEVALVLLGGVGGALVTFGFERFVQRERRDLREAKRLVGQELETVILHLSLLLRAGRIPERVALAFDPEQFLPTDMWHSYRGVLARFLSAEEFATLNYVFVESEQRRREYARPGDFPGRRLKSHEIAHIKELKRLAVDKGHQALRVARPDILRKLRRPGRTDAERFRAEQASRRRASASP